MKYRKIWADTFSIIASDAFFDQVEDFFVEDMAHQLLHKKSAIDFEDAVHRVDRRAEVRCDFRTGRTCVYRTVAFHCYTLDVCYRVNGQSFSKRVDMTVSGVLKPDGRIRITCAADDPTQIIDIDQYGPGLRQILRKLRNNRKRQANS